MVVLLRTLALLGGTILEDAARRAAAAFAGLLAAGCLLATSLGFFTLAAHRALLAAIGEALAALVIGGAYLVAGLIVLLALQLRRR